MSHSSKSTNRPSSRSPVASAHDASGRLATAIAPTAAMRALAGVHPPARTWLDQYLVQTSLGPSRAVFALALTGLLSGCGGIVREDCSVSAPCPSTAQVCDLGVCRWRPEIDVGAVMDAGTEDSPDVAYLDAFVHDASFDAPMPDASGDASFDASGDASFDASGDASFDASGDASFDASGDASFDAATGPDLACRLENRNSDCPPEHLCEADATAAGPCPVEGPGICRPIEASCTSVPAAGSIECGCDGRTYVSACERRRAGARLAGAGFCTCDAARPCTDPDTFCDYGLAYSSMECSARAEGVCSRVPTATECDMASRERVQVCDDADTTTRSDCERRAARLPRAFAPPDCLHPASGRDSCFDDADCSAGRVGVHCYGAICQAVATESTLGSCRAAPSAGSCYADADCSPGHRCGMSGSCEFNPLSTFGP